MPLWPNTISWFNSPLTFLLFPCQIRLDESQEVEQQQLKDRLDRELEILMAYQSKNKLNAEKQRSKERHELEDRVRVRRSLLEKKVGGRLAFVEVVN